MYKSTFLIIFSITIIFSHFAQEVKIKEGLKESDYNKLNEVIDYYFSSESNFAFTFGIYDLQTFDKMSSEEKTSDEYRQELVESIQKDSSNITIWNNLGTFYSNVNELKESRNAYQEALNRISKDYFAKESSYYSFRAQLKSNLGIESALSDYEKALDLNKTDSIAIYFYPMELLNLQQYDKVKHLSLEALKEENEMMYISYIMFCIATLMENFSNDSETNKNTFYKKLIDYKEIDEIAQNYKSNFYIQTINDYAHITGLLYKIGVGFSFSELKSPPYWSLKRREQRIIENLLSKFKNHKEKEKINVNSLNYVLATLHLFQSNFDKSIELAKEGLNTIPQDKITFQFNDKRIYNLLIGIYFFKEELNQSKKLIRAKNKEMQLKNYEKSDLYNLGIIHYKNNELDSSRFFCNLIIDNYGYDFETLTLMIQISFEENNFNEVDIIVPLSFEQIQDHSEYEKIYTLLVIYQILLEKPNAAYDLIQEMEKELSINDIECDHCEMLKSEFLEIKD